MAKKIDDIPEIVVGAADIEAPEDLEPEIVEPEPKPATRARSKKAQANANVRRLFVANDYEHSEQPVKELRRDIREEYGTDFDPWKIMVTVKMGRKPSGESGKFAIRVNGRKFELAYRENHDVPLPIAIAWLRHQTSNEIAEDMADTMTEHYQKLAEQKIL